MLYLNQKQEGFTLIELLVVIAIISVLTGVASMTVASSLDKSRVARAQSDLEQLKQAVLLLQADTGLLPGGLDPADGCKQNPEIQLDASDAGVMSNDGTFSNWNGPYLSELPTDPWGRQYLFDPDYRCYSSTKGCENVANDTMVRAIVSGGPNGSFSYGDPADLTNDPTDNIVIIMCVP